MGLSTDVSVEPTVFICENENVVVTQGQVCVPLELTGDRVGLCNC